MTAVRPWPPRPAPLSDEAAVRLTVAFSEGEGAGLLHLGAAELDTPLPPALAFFRELSRSLLGRVCQLAEPEQHAPRAVFIGPRLPVDVIEARLRALRD